jgi:hypothetical protein
MRKQKQKNPHAVALGKLGGSVRSKAKKLANKENGSRAVWSKAARKLWRPGAMHGGHGLDAAKIESADRSYSRPIRPLRHWTR